MEMGEVLDSYVINEDTVFLKPYKDDKMKQLFTFVLEVNKWYIVKMSPFAIINRSCKWYGRSFKNTMKDSQKLFVNQRNIPCLICRKRSLTLFQTCSHRQTLDCCYISPDHIQRIISEQGGVRIKFDNGAVIKINSSYPFINKMRHKCYMMIGYFSRK